MFFDKIEFGIEEDKSDEMIIYELDLVFVFDIVIYEYIKGIIFGVMMDLYVSEFAVRMIVMDNVIKSVDEMI